MSPLQRRDVVNTPSYKGAALSHAVDGLPWSPSQERLRIIGVLLNMGANLYQSNRHNHFNAYPLVRAVEKRQRKALTIMITHTGLDTDDRVRSLEDALRAALYEGDLPAFKQLQEAGAAYKSSALFSLFGLALSKGKLPIAEYLMEIGYPTNPTALEGFDGNENYVSLAASSGLLKIIPPLLDCGCDPTKGKNPLVAWLDRRSTLNNILLDSRILKGDVGKEALEYVVEHGDQYGRLINMRLLVEAGVDPAPVLGAHAKGKIRLPQALHMSFWVSLLASSNKAKHETNAHIPHQSDGVAEISPQEASVHFR